MATSAARCNNLRRAAAALNGVLIPAGQGCSASGYQVGPATRARGYADGRMLQQGCLVPSVGGGLCQLSNALYQAALEADCDIIERHAHSRVVPGSASEIGRDATVAWNYVDLRFRAPQTLLIEAALTADDQVIRFRGATDERSSPARSAQGRGTAEGGGGARATPADLRRADANLPTSRRPLRRPAADTSPAALRAGGGPQFSDEPRTCSTCDQVSCFRHDRAQGAASQAMTAWLVDENWPEFQAWAAETCGPDDLLATPFADAVAPARYRWNTKAFRRRDSATIQALGRMWAIRNAGPTNAKRRQAELDGAGRIARRLARLAGPNAERLVVSQSLLPFLWREGELGGRHFDVLMTRPPIAALQARLDAAFSAHPERKSLGDFRATPWLAEAEQAALTAATRVITPHAIIADLFGTRAVEIPWQAPKPRARSDTANPRRIAFPGPTVARKGAWDVREAARALDI